MSDATREAVIYQVVKDIALAEGKHFGPTNANVTREYLLRLIVEVASAFNERIRKDRPLQHE